MLIHGFRPRLAATLAATALPLALVFAAPSLAQAPAPAPAAAQAPADPVVARVNGTEIRLSDLADAAQGLPAEMRSMPPGMLYPLLLDQLIARAAIVELARKRGIGMAGSPLEALDQLWDEVKAAEKSGVTAP